ncbi:hypothetical protein A3464_18900 [Enterobacter genomosp. O]|uniref:hypothetical protein n=1 Tax=Enterobacter genomosp. O TaxID=2364150 RepID=UPI0007B395A8|nr:hypothetical protein [Enterobacter genomosp. O]KZQ38547.1 hypothetical protein A3464_18900 [Enterobacter genomosp. O]
MSNMVYRHGDSKKWKGVSYDYEIVSDEDLQEHLDAGWVSHPDDLLKDGAEPEKKERKKPGRKPKAATDESHD